MFFGRNADNVLRDLSHASAWRSMLRLYTLTARLQRDFATTVHEKMWCAVCVSVCTSRQEIKFPASDITSLNKEEKLLFSPG